jgi:hypothetical protein
MPTGLAIAINASALIERSAALSSVRTLRPGHFSHVASLAGATLIQIAAAPVVLRPAHFDNPHTLGGATLTASAGDEEDDMTPRRFWRLQMLKQASNGFALDELQFRTVVSGGQAATGGTPIESGHFGSEVPANAFDGATSKWAGGALSGLEYLGYDFGAGNEVDIVEVAIKSYTSEQAQTPYIFLVQKGDDGICWKDAWMGETTPDWGAAETRVFTRPA